MEGDDLVLFLVLDQPMTMHNTHLPSCICLWQTEGQAAVKGCSVLILVKLCKVLCNSLLSKLTLGPLTCTHSRDYSKWK